jgi:hypothetical protein
MQTKSNGLESANQALRIENRELKGKLVPADDEASGGTTESDKEGSDKKRRRVDGHDGTAGFMNVPEISFI